VTDLLTGIGDGQLRNRQRRRAQQRRPRENDKNRANIRTRPFISHCNRLKPIGPPSVTTTAAKH
jgi:hypothetical protein